MNGWEQYADTYEIRGKLGEGSGGIVYLAYHKRLQKEVVLKRVKSKNLTLETKRQEVDILKNLNHAFLPQVFDFLTVGNDVYTVMSFIPGKSFQQLMDEGARFTQSQMIQWGMQLCSALDYLHSQNPPVIHSDIKPANIMLKPDGNICLIDFNISFFLDGSTVLGYSEGYTSPEMYILILDQRSSRSIGNYKSVDQRTDIYSVGSVFYYLVTGKKRKDFRTPVDRKLLTERTSPAFAQVVLRAIQPDSKNRFSNAHEMFLSFQDIPKRDGEYLALLKKQRGIRIGLFLLMICFILLGGFGIHQMKLERVEAYNKIVDKQKDSIEEQDYEEAEEQYEDAKELLPGALESYYQNACSLYQQREYQACLDFIDYDILDNEKIDQTQGRMTDVYHLKGDCYYQLEKYTDAVEAYEAMFDYEPYDWVYYRDYAIALAYDGKRGKAEEVLEEAIDHGMEKDSIYYAKGEIEKASGEVTEAISDFSECISRTEDASLKERAYILSSKIYEQLNRRKDEKALLDKAVEMLPVKNQMIILERLIQADIDLAAQEGSTSYLTDAVSQLQKVIDQGWDTYQTYDNLVILYQKLGNITEAESTLATMVNQFGEDYNIYKRYAFLEIDKQQLKANLSRNYSVFANYYNQAETLYRDSNNYGSDTEMQLLEQTREELIRGGWL